MQEIELAAKIKKGDKEARALMIRSNLRLVVKIAHDYANLGLAAARSHLRGQHRPDEGGRAFRSRKGRQAQHLCGVVDQAIDQARAGEPEQDDPPAGSSGRQDLEDAPRLAADERGTWPRTDRRRARRRNRHRQRQSFAAEDRFDSSASLDAPISDDDSTEFGEIVGDEEAQTPFELLRDKNLRNEVGGLLDVLDDRERKIIFSRFGLDGGKPKTLEEVGKKFGVTRERIRQLQNIALSKLRRALSKKERPVDVELPVEA